MVSTVGHVSKLGFKLGSLAKLSSGHELSSYLGSIKHVAETRTLLLPNHPHLLNLRLHLVQKLKLN